MHILLFYYLIIACRHYMGEELETLSMKDLQNLEHQIDVSLKHIRTRKVHFFIYATRNSRK